MATLQSYDYEDVHPVIEKKNTPDSHLLIVQIPDGFARGDIGAKVEYDFGRVRVFGERSAGSNKRIRFNVKYQVPSHCDIGNIKGKIDGKIVTITMPNIPGRVPQPEEEPTEENNNKAEEVNDQKDQQNTSDQDPKSNVESKEDATPQDAQKVQEENSQKDQVAKVDSKGETYHETSTSQEATQESLPQKDQEEISQKESLPQKGQEEISQKESLPQKGQEEISQKSQVAKVESKENANQETSTQSEGTHESLPQKGQEEISQKESLPQKGQEEISQKTQVTKVESKENAHQETSTQSEGTHESKPQKGQDQGIQNKPTDTKDAKLQTEESVKDENKEKQMVVKEETKDHLKKAIETVKSHVADDSSPTLERKTKDESKGSATVETFPPMKTYKEKGKEIINDKFGDHDEKKILDSTRTRIKDMALSTTQAVTSYAKRFSEEDKQKLIYTGATILVVALGVYASYKYRSSRRA